MLPIVTISIMTRIDLMKILDASSSMKKPRIVRLNQTVQEDFAHTGMKLQEMQKMIIMKVMKMLNGVT